MLNKKLLFINLLIVQVAIVGTLITIIYHQKSNKVLGISTYKINKKDVTYSKTDNIKYFYELIPGQVMVEQAPWDSNKRITHTITQSGLNQLKDYPIKKEKDSLRIVALGDSFTFGVYVATSDNYPSQLERILKNSCKENIQLLNLGVPGYDIQYAIAHYNLKGKQYDPDLVIWIIKDDDVDQVSSLMQDVVKIMKDDLENKGTYDQLQREGDYYPEFTAAYNYFQHQYSKEQILDMQNKFLDEFDKNYTKSLVLVTFPNSSEDTKKFLKDFTRRRKNTYYLEDIRDIYKYSDEYFPDKHPTEKGYTYISHDIANYLTQNKIISCN